jgi:hypothetical protein
MTKIYNHKRLLMTIMQMAIREKLVIWRTIIKSVLKNNAVNLIRTIGTAQKNKV